MNKQEKQITFTVKCSKGTYIRTLCEDIAEKLNTVGYTKELNRISVGEFNIENSLTVKELESSIEKNDFSMIIKIEDLLNFPKIDLKKKDLDKYLNGVKITINSDNGPYKIYLENKFIGIGTVENRKLKRDLVTIGNF